MTYTNMYNIFTDLKMFQLNDAKFFHKIFFEYMIYARVRFLIIINKKFYIVRLPHCMLSIYAHMVNFLNRTSGRYSIVLSIEAIMVGRIKFGRVI